MLATRIEPIRVAEFERVVPPGGVNPREFEARLLAATEQFPFEVFRRTRYGLQAQGFVGLIDDGKFSVELVPKAGLLDADPDGRAAAALLLNLLSYAGITPRAVPLDARVERTRRPLLEAVARGFAAALAQRLTDGVPRRYRERAERSFVIRGRLEMRELARRPLATDGRVPVRYAPLQPDHELSRVIASTARLVAQVTHSARTWSTLQYCLAHLDDVRVGLLTPELVSSVELSRTETHWEPILDMARLLASGWRPMPVRAGGARTLSLVFPINDLFESVLRRALPRALAPHGAALAPRRPDGRLLRSTTSGQYAISLRPDFLFRSVQSPDLLLVGDAKWKVLENTKNFGLHEDDVYQLVTYMTRHRLKDGVLFFPLRPWMTSNRLRQWSHSFEMVDAPDVHLSLVGVDIEELVSRDPHRRHAAEVALGASLVHNVPLATTSTRSR